MNRSQLEAIASELQIKKTKNLDDENLAYAILDEEAKAESLKPIRKQTAKARRPRKEAAPEDVPAPEKVAETEQPEVKKTRGRKKTKPSDTPVEQDAEKQTEVKEEAPAAQQPAPAEAPVAKKRGRKPGKANKEQVAAPAEAVEEKSAEEKTAGVTDQSQKEAAAPIISKIRERKQQNQQNQKQQSQQNQQNQQRPQQQPQNDQKDVQQQAQKQSQQQFQKPQKPKAYEYEGTVEASGVLEIMPDGYGFLRSSDYNYLNSPDDIYVSQQQIKVNALKDGDTVLGEIRPPREGDKYFPLVRIKSVNGRSLEFIRDRVPFDFLTALFPEEKFNLLGNGHESDTTCRIIDLFSPIGKGQRFLITSPPKSGKTLCLKSIANAIADNHPEVYQLVLLVDERPEEVTDMKRTVKAEVVASTFDEPAEKHVKVANMVLEKARRLVECGHDVVIYLDSITRLARAYNTVQPASGKVLSGGVDANALQKPKRFFGAARNIENGGSLTIIATALIETCSKMDQVIFEEFCGTGNSEAVLDRSLSNRRIFPAVNILLSSTRRDDLLLNKSVANRIWILRKLLADMNPIEAMNFMLQLMDEYKTNDLLIDNMSKVSYHG